MEYVLSSCDNGKSLDRREGGAASMLDRCWQMCRWQKMEGLDLPMCRRPQPALLSPTCFCPGIGVTHYKHRITCSKRIGQHGLRRKRFRLAWQPHHARTGRAPSVPPPKFVGSSANNQCAATKSFRQVGVRTWSQPSVYYCKSNSAVDAHVCGLRARKRAKRFGFKNVHRLKCTYMPCSPKRHNGGTPESALSKTGQQGNNQGAFLRNLTLHEKRCTNT